MQTRLDKTPSVVSKKCMDWARTVGMIINNTHAGYWLSRSDTELGYNESFLRLQEALTELPQLSLSAFKDTLQINETDVVLEDEPLLSVLVRHMVNCEITDFAISREVTKIDYSRFLEIISLRPAVIARAGGFVKMVTDEKLQAIRVVKAVYKRVSENETVVSGDALKTAGAGVSEAMTQQIMALLNGSDAPDELQINAMAMVTGNPKRLAELIMEAVKSEADVSTTTAVPQCVRRAFDRLITDPSMKTQKGKKALARMLASVEEELVETVGGDGETAAALRQAVEAMQDELQMETIAAEYVKKRKAIEASEQRILRYMHNKGLDQLQGSEFGSKLTELGLDPGAMSALAGSGLPPPVQSGVTLPPPVPWVPGLTSLTVDHLISLIEHIDSELNSIEQIKEKTPVEGKGKAHAVVTSLVDAGRDLKTVLTKTEDKVRRLVETVQEDHERVRAMESMAESRGQGPRISRRQLMEMLAEIVQEICQPIAVINSSIDLLVMRILGEITQDQLDVLTMAKESASRTLVIAGQLKELSGMPETRQPDHQILGKIYTPPVA